MQSSRIVVEIIKNNQLKKILIIGQLPSEVGGNYTTGVGNVVYELSKYELNDKQLFVFGSNIKSNVANKLNSLSSSKVFAPG